MDNGEAGALNLSARADPSVWDLAPRNSATLQRFGAILADPPWRYHDKREGRGGASAHYATLTPSEIRALPVQLIAAGACALFLWVTPPMLRAGISVVEAWGFEYKTIAFTWVKQSEAAKPAWGTGAWTRANAEHCLLGIKGRPKRKSASVHSLIFAPRREHSRKPDETYERIEKLLGPVPRIELFARQRRKGWAAWGDQLPPIEASQ